MPDPSPAEDLVPALQLSDLDALKAAQAHLEEHGYRTRVGPFDELPEDRRESWMNPADGGYLFYLEQSRWDAAMTLLGRFFGCTD
jgi:hypothetical protein